jgi:glycerol-3-phosphate acyltransferase PlsY
MFNVLILILTAYIVGSFPTAIIAGRLLKGIDIRTQGSGNAGATNVLRVLGWKAGLSVLLIDMLKGFIPVFFVAPYFSAAGLDTIYLQIIAAFGAIIGHVYTVFAGFKGGKGVGTAAGVFLGLAPAGFSVALLVFIMVVWITRFVSLGSLLAALSLLLVLSYQKFILHNLPSALYILAAVVVILIWYSHRENIRRLLKGQENKISFTRKEGA